MNQSGSFLHTVFNILEQAIHVIPVEHHQLIALIRVIRKCLCMCVCMCVWTYSWFCGPWDTDRSSGSPIFILLTSSTWDMTIDALSTVPLPPSLSYWPLSRQTHRGCTVPQISFLRLYSSPLCWRKQLQWPNSRTMVGKNKKQALTDIFLLHGYKVTEG